MVPGSQNVFQRSLISVVCSLSRWNCHPANRTIVETTPECPQETGVNIRWPKNSRRGRWSRFTNMVSRLTDLPTEILEEILLHLPGQDIVKLEAVRCIVVIPDDSALTLVFHCAV